MLKKETKPIVVAKKAFSGLKVAQVQPKLTVLEVVSTTDPKTTSESVEWKTKHSFEKSLAVWHLAAKWRRQGFKIVEEVAPAVFRHMLERLREALTVCFGVRVSVDPLLSETADNVWVQSSVADELPASVRTGLRSEADQYPV